MVGWGRGEGRGQHDGGSVLSDNTPTSGSNPRVIRAHLAGLLQHLEGHGDPAGEAGVQRGSWLEHALCMASETMQAPDKKQRQSWAQLSGRTSSQSFGVSRVPPAQQNNEPGLWG